MTTTATTASAYAGSNLAVAPLTDRTGVARPPESRRRRATHGRRAFVWAVAVLTVAGSGATFAATRQPGGPHLVTNETFTFAEAPPSTVTPTTTATTKKVTPAPPKGKSTPTAPPAKKSSTAK